MFLFKEIDSKVTESTAKLYAFHYVNPFKNKIKTVAEIAELNSPELTLGIYDELMKFAKKDADYFIHEIYNALKKK